MLKRLSVWSVAAAILLGGTAVAFGGHRPDHEAHPGHDEGPTIVVAGRGEVSVAPDRAVVWIGVSVQDTTADSAQSKCNERMNSVIEAIKKMGIAAERIQTSRADLYPVYEQSRPNDNREPQVIAYRASNSVRIELEDLKRIGATVDAAIKAGANQVNSIGFELKNDGAARKDAITRAVKDAREKAETIAAALGGTLGEMLEAEEGQAQMSPPRPMRGRTMSARALDSDASMPVETGQMQVRATVSIRYAYKKP